jgi:hypothetical protein
MIWRTRGPLHVTAICFPQKTGACHRPLTMARLGVVVLAFAGVFNCIAGQATAAEWSFASRVNTGPDTRSWAGSSATATNGLQIVTNYGGELKFKQQDLFAITGSIDSGYLHAQSKQIIFYVPPGTFTQPSPPSQNIYQIFKYAAGGPLDIYMSGRFDLLVNPIVQPYFYYGYNASQKPTRSIYETFAFSSDSDRDLRTAFGSGDFYEIRTGSVININKNLAADVSWQRNFGTRYQPYNYRSDINYNDGNQAITARLQYYDDKFTASIQFQNTQFFENGSYYNLGYCGCSIDFDTPALLERWIYGDLRIWNAKTEYRFDEHWFSYAEAIYSRQKNNVHANQYYWQTDKPTDFVLENPDSNPIKYSGIFGIGYFVAPWTFQIQALYSVDLANHYPRICDGPGCLPERFLPRHERIGGEAIINFRQSDIGSLTGRVSLLHVDGLASVPQGSEAGTVPPYEPAQIVTVYLTGTLNWEPR